MVDTEQNAEYSKCFPNEKRLPGRWPRKLAEHCESVEPSLEGKLTAAGQAHAEYREKINLYMEAAVRCRSTSYVDRFYFDKKIQFLKEESAYRRRASTLKKKTPGYWRAKKQAAKARKYSRNLLSNRQVDKKVTENYNGLTNAPLEGNQ